MKKTILALATLLLATSTYAQLSGGFKAGLSISGAKYDVDGETGSLDSRTGFHLGGYFNLSLANSISIQPELVYTTAGGTDTYEEPGFYEGEDTYTFSYITVPVMFIFKLGQVFNLQAGPQLGFVVSGELEEDYTDFVEPAFSGRYKYDISEVFKGTDFVFNVGAGVNLGRVNFTARYGFGLANISQEDFIDGIIKTTNFQVSLGVKAFGY